MDPPESAHLARVLRARVGDTVDLFDGEQRAWRGVLECVSPDRVEGRLVAIAPTLTPPYRLRLIQALCKGDKFDFVVQKAVELGVADIVPLLSRRVVVRPPADRWAARRDRWNRIARGAAQQCGRADVPGVGEPVLFADALRRFAGPTWIPWEGETDRPLNAVLKPFAGGELNVMIGPEGGFDPGEVALAVGAGAVAVSLGPYVLRTETAGLFVASALLYEWAGGRTGWPAAP